MKKPLIATIACIVVLGCIGAAGCVDSTGPALLKPGDAVWTATEYDNGAVKEQITLIFHTDGTGEKKWEKWGEEKSLRTFTWTQPDRCHFVCTFTDDGDIDTFTLTGNGKLTHDGKYYQCEQQGTIPVVTTPVASPRDHPDIVGTWETYELKKKGLDTKTLEFRADGTGTRTKLKAKGTFTEEPFTWVPVGSCYLITYEYADDDDTVRIVDGTLDHDGELFSRIS